MPDTKLPSDSPSEPSASPVRARLKDRVPPKPPRRGSAIPPALLVSTTATKIPPAPRPPKPQGSSLPRPASSRPKAPPAQNWALDPHAERQTMGPVAAPVLPPLARQQGVTSALIGLIAIGVLASGSWFLHERSSERQSASRGVSEVVNANAARPTAVTKASPAPAAAVRALDQDSGTASNAAPSEAVANNALGPSTTVPSAKDPKPEQSAQTAALSAASESPKHAEPEVPSTPIADGSATDDAETTTTVAETEPAVPTQLPPFDAQAAKSALTAGALSASSCRKGDDPRGTAEVIVTFAPSGRITSANVNGAPYGGTATGGCVAATLRSATVPPFAGNHVTVRKLVSIR